MSSESFDVAIIGAGIVGAACAVECAREKMNVIIIEAKEIGGGATAAGMGHLVVMDDSEAQFALTNYSQRLWRELSHEIPTDTEYVECGTIWVAADVEEMEEVKRKQIFYSDRKVNVEILDEKSLKEAEPNLREGLAGGLLVSNDGVIYPPCAARFLIEKAQALGACLEYGRVQSISDNGVTLNDGLSISAKIIVNAAGSWSPELTPGIDVQKRKGHLAITDRYPGFVRHQLVELGYLKSAHSLTSDSVAFNVQPRQTGQLLIGSSRQYGVDDPKIDRDMLGKMLDRAIEYMPRLAGLSTIRTWTGFRAATPDKLPLIGPHPARKNLWLATGHEGLGITTSMATGRLLVDQIMNRASEIPIEPYLPVNPGGARVSRAGLTKDSSRN
jgi:glycine/D-amino acid oxidase-like deaminating enzyme